MLFLEPDERRVRVVGAVAVPFLDLLLGLERLAAVAVVALVDALVDVAGVEDGLDELLAAGVMALLAGLDEVVVARCRARARHPGTGGPCRRRIACGLDAQLAGALGHLDRVLVVAHQEVDVAAFHPAEASLHVGADLLERRADVRPAVGIVDRRRDVDNAVCLSIILDPGCSRHCRARKRQALSSRTVGIAAGRFTILRSRVESTILSTAIVTRRARRRHQSPQPVMTGRRGARGPAQGRPA